VSAEQFRSAAQARREAVAQLSDRPRERRTGQSPESRAHVAHVAFAAALTARESGDASLISFRGIASAYEQPYEMYDAFGPYNEVVSRGAGAKSLSRTDLDVPLVLGHDQMRRIARTTNGSLTLKETSDGLEVTAPDLSIDDLDVAYIAPKIREGLLDEMSFAFQIIKGVWSPDFTEFRIVEYDIHRGDVSIVGFGANPHTTAELRHVSGEDLIPAEETRLLSLY
jgi:HK97 family phage prohead protease